MRHGSKGCCLTFFPLANFAFSIEVSRPSTGGFLFSTERDHLPLLGRGWVKFVWNHENTSNVNVQEIIGQYSPSYRRRVPENSECCGGRKIRDFHVLVNYTNLNWGFIGWLRGHKSRPSWAPSENCCFRNVSTTSFQIHGDSLQHRTKTTPFVRCSARGTFLAENSPDPLMDLTRISWPRSRRTGTSPVPERNPWPLVTKSGAHFPRHIQHHHQELLKERPRASGS